MVPSAEFIELERQTRSHSREQARSKHQRRKQTVNKSKRGREKQQTQLTVQDSKRQNIKHEINKRLRITDKKESKGLTINQCFYSSCMQISLLPSYTVGEKQYAKGVVSQNSQYS